MTVLCTVSVRVPRPPAPVPSPRTSNPVSPIFCSFVRSITMDSWSEKQIKMMRAGGNQKLLDWFESHGVTRDQRITKKYHSPAAELFRERYGAPLCCFVVFFAVTCTLY